MHEMGLCEAVLAVVRAVSRDEPVSRVRVRVGRLQGVAPDAFLFCWRVLAQETGAAGAAMDLSDVPVRVRCRSCAAEGATAAGLIACDRCGSPSVEITAGTELEVVEVELRGGGVLRNPGLAAVEGS